MPCQATSGPGSESMHTCAAGPLWQQNSNALVWLSDIPPRRSLTTPDVYYGTPTGWAARLFSALLRPEQFQDCHLTAANSARSIAVVV